MSARFNKSGNLRGMEPKPLFSGRPWYVEYRRYLRRKNQQFMRDYLMEHGCSRCGYNENVAALEFHHRDPATKVRAVSTMSGAGRPSLEAEIAKCEVLCANCHAIETYERTFT